MQLPSLSALSANLIDAIFKENYLNSPVPQGLPCIHKKYGSLFGFMHPSTLSSGSATEN